MKNGQTLAGYGDDVLIEESHIPSHSRSTPTFRSWRNGRVSIAISMAKCLLRYKK
jgi:hypothetical protein